jgi:hypothetical protein
MGSGIGTTELESADFTMRLLPKDEITMELMGDGEHIIASFFEYPIGYRHYEKYYLADFPNRLASLENHFSIPLPLVGSLSNHEL